MVSGVCEHTKKMRTGEDLSILQQYGLVFHCIYPSQERNSCFAQRAKSSMVNFNYRDVLPTPASPLLLFSTMEVAKKKHKRSTVGCVAYT